MNTKNNDLEARLRVLAGKVGEMPATGAIGAERALAIMGEAISILGVALAESTKSTARATEWAERCDRLYAANIALMTSGAWDNKAATA